MNRTRAEKNLVASVRVVSLWTVAFAVIHSLLASRTVKDWVRRRYGVRAFNGVYRLAFNLLALITFTGLLFRFSRLSDREIYRVGRPWSLAMRAVQAVGILMALDANVRIGLGRMLGVQGFVQWVRREKPIDQNPAQGPQLEGNLAFRTGGSFQLTRHPNNLVPLLLWTANPKMTVRFLAFILVSAFYLILGSVHEERRLKAAYGRRYERYRAGIPFYFPLFK